MNTTLLSRTAVAGMLALAMGLTIGCGGPGEVSTTAYEYSKSLYAITNRQADSLLPGVRQQIDDDLQADKLSHAEAKLLGAIIRQAEQGDWKGANRESRAIMEAQVTR